MNSSRSSLLLVCVGLLAAASAQAQLTCNGSLVCSNSTAAYTFTNNGTGNGVNVNVPSGLGRALNVSIGGGDGVHVESNAGGTAGYFKSALGLGILADSSGGTQPAIDAEGHYYHAIEATTGSNTTALYHGIKALNIAASGTGGYGVFGQSSRNTGVYGKALLAGQYGVYASGNLGASGTKTFVEPHPVDAGKQIRYAAMEGPEAGTYFRGSARLTKGFARISVPEDFRIVSSDKGLTVHVTPTGQLALVTCIKKNLDEIIIQGSQDVEFDYIVHGVRKAFADFQPIVDNVDFVPHASDDPEFAMGLPEESIRRLKANGTLNEDGSVNLQTAVAKGWDKQETWTREANAER